MRLFDRSFAQLCLAIAAIALVSLLFAPDHTQASPATPVAKEEQKSAKPEPADAKTASGELDTDWKDRIKQLEDRERQAYSQSIEAQRKTLDWWFSYLAVVTAVLALLGAILPYLMARKEKEGIQLALQEAKKSAEDAAAAVSLAKEAVAHLNKVKNNANSILEGIRLTASNPAEKAEDRKLAQQVLNDKQSSLAEKLQAQAIQATLEENWSKARILWELLAGEQPENAQAWFGWGVSLQSFAKQNAGSDLPTALKYWEQAGEKYALALQIKADMHEAAYNWGLALDSMAQAVAGRDVPAALKYWERAGEKYALALQIKADMHEAACNWGDVLDCMAQAVAGRDVPAALKYWERAGEKYALALQIKTDKHEAANNWGIALCLMAQAVKGSDVPAALKYWEHAGEKYGLALQLKADMYEAANNWGISLNHMAQAVAGSDRAAALQYWQTAREKCLLAEKIKPGSGAYNLACVFSASGNEVLEALTWLNTTKAYKSLPDAAHLRSDKDLDSIRHTPEFIAWWQDTFGPDEPVTN